MFGKKQSKELKAKIEECKKKFLEYINSCSEENKLNMLFTELTLFRANHDGKDGIIQNIKDYLKRKEDISRSAWIYSQLDDILDNFTDNDSQYDREFNELMNRLIPQDKYLNGWDAFWSWLWSNFDKMAGKK